MAALGALAWPSTAPAKLVYEEPRSGRIVVADDRTGAVERVLGTGRFPKVSPDGRWVAFKRPDRGLLLQRTAGGFVRRLTTEDGSYAWSSTGRRLAFTVDTLDRPRLRIRDVRHGRTRTVAALVDAESFGIAFSPGGRYVAVAQGSLDLAALYVRDLRRRRWRRVGPSDDFSTGPAWGVRHLAFGASTGTRYDACCAQRPFLWRPGTLRRIGRAGDVPLDWSADGRTLLLARGRRAVLAAPATGRVTTVPGGDVAPAALSEDGRWVLGRPGGDIVAVPVRGGPPVVLGRGRDPSWSR